MNVQATYTQRLKPSLGGCNLLWLWYFANESTERPIRRQAQCGLGLITLAPGPKLGQMGETALDVPAGQMVGRIAEQYVVQNWNT